MQRPDTPIRRPATSTPPARTKVGVDCARKSATKGLARDHS